MIDINDITLRIGSKVLLEHASAHISDGQKVGLVGANGCGKSTLFRALKGELETETGSIYFPKGYRVVFVEQEMHDINIPIMDFLLASDVERAELLQKLETASESELGEIHERLKIIKAASAPARAVLRCRRRFLRAKCALPKLIPCRKWWPHGSGRAPVPWFPSSSCPHGWPFLRRSSRPWASSPRP